MFPSDPYSHSGTKRTSPLDLTEWNEVGDVLAAVTTTLGTDPQGGYATTRAWLDALQTAVAALGRCGVRNLVVTNDATSPNSKITVTADLLGLEGSLISGVTVSADITAEGKNGFDNLTADPEDANTWYFVWVGYKPTTDERCALLSKASARASLVLSHSSLAGFTEFRRVGAVRNDGSANFLRFVQLDADVEYLLSGMTWGVASNATQQMATPSTEDLSAWVPPTTRRARLGVALVSGTAGAIAEVMWRVTGSGLSGTRAAQVDVTNNVVCWSVQPVMTDASRQIDLGFAAAPGTGQSFWAQVMGYYDPI